MGHAHRGGNRVVVTKIINRFHVGCAIIDSRIAQAAATVDRKHVARHVQVWAFKAGAAPPKSLAVAAVLHGDFIVVGARDSLLSKISQ